MPEKFKELHKEEHCIICKTNFNTPKNAIAHYDSPKHQEKLNAKLANWSKNTGKPVPNRKIIDKNMIGKKMHRCELCEIDLNSIAHVKQHRLGRKHKK